MEAAKCYLTARPLARQILEQSEQTELPITGRERVLYLFKKMNRSWNSRHNVASRDPDEELHVKRARNDRKLKSIFESIFEKYSKDFSDVADEIDMNTGEVVRENGHILNMTHEKDIGVGKETTPSESDDQSAQDCLDEDPSSRTVEDSQDHESSDDDPLGYVEDAIKATASRMKQSGFSTSSTATNRESNTGPCASALTQSAAPNASRLPMSVERTGIRPPTEDIWWAPELPQDRVLNRGLPSPDSSDVEGSDATRSPSPPGTSLWALPKQRAPRSKRVGLSEHNSEVSGIPGTPLNVWSVEEDDLLRSSKTTTNLKYCEILDRFPGRTVVALRTRWSLLKQGALSVPFVSRVAAWAPEEDQLLRHLRSSTNKRWAEIQQELPARSINAIKTRWHILQHKAAQSLLRDESPSSHSSDLPSLEEMIKNNAFSQKGPPKKNEQPELSYAVESSHLNTADMEHVDTSTYLERNTLDDLESPSLSRMRRHFPTGTVVPDSQSGTSSQVQPSGPELVPESSSGSHVHEVQPQDINPVESSVEVETSPKPLSLPMEAPEPSLQETYEDSPVEPGPTYTPAPPDLGEHLPLPFPKKGPVIGTAPPPTVSPLRSNGPLPTDGSNTILTSVLGCQTESKVADVPDIIEISSSGESPESTTSSDRASKGSKRASPSLNSSLKPGILAANTTFDAVGQATYQSEEGCSVRMSTGSGTEFPTHPAATSLVFKHVGISMPSLAVMGDQRPKSPIRVGTPVVQKAGQLEALSTPLTTPERPKRWIEPFTLALLNNEATADEVLAQRQKYFTNKSYLVRKDGPTPLHEAGSRRIQNEADDGPILPDVLDRTETQGLEILQSMEPLRSLEPLGTVPVEETASAHTSPTSGQKRKRGLSSNGSAGDDEDDLQLSLAPAMAPPILDSRRNSGVARIHRLPFRPRAETPDVSDDELSTPAKSARKQIEMTPLRSLTAGKRRLTSMF
ncbi:MAG: hypothetical protein Q9174_001728 [Haloplaca sp. 1 TL-2023]